MHDDFGMVVGSAHSYSLMPMPSILFVCYANQFRSPAAAVYMRREIEKAGLESDWTVQSAGTWLQGRAVRPALLRELKRIGVSLEDHRTRPVDAELLANQDLILVMEQGQLEAMQAEFPEARDRIFLLSQVAEGLVYDIPDPNRDSGFTYIEAARDLEELIKKGFTKICHMAESSRDARRS
jgi:protein-tyrosine-phosphatase